MGRNKNRRGSKHHQPKSTDKLKEVSQTGEDNRFDETSKRCPHVGSCTNVSRLKAVLHPKKDLRQCDDCPKDAKTAEYSVWICLKCFHKGCDRTSPGQHALRHVEKQATHQLVIHVQTLQIWCYGCDESVEANQSDTLRGFVSEVRRRRAPDQVGHSSRCGEESGTSFQQPGIKGLANLGNTCFFNSVIQNLNQTTLLHGFLARVNETGMKVTLCIPDGPQTSLEISIQDPPGKVTTSLLALFREIRTSHGPHVNPRAVFTSICTRVRRFGGYQQQDSHELLRYLLDEMKMEEQNRMKRGVLMEFGVTSGSKDGMKKLSDSDRADIKAYGRNLGATFVENVFGGEFMSSVLCLQCQQVSSQLEEFLDLSLSIPSEVKLPGGGTGSGNDKQPTSSVSDLPLSKHQKKKNKKEEKKKQKQAMKNKQKFSLSQVNKIFESTTENDTASSYNQEVTAGTVGQVLDKQVCTDSTASGLSTAAGLLEGSRLALNSTSAEEKVECTDDPDGLVKDIELKEMLVESSSGRSEVGVDGLLEDKARLEPVEHKKGNDSCSQPDATVTGTPLTGNDTPLHENVPGSGTPLTEDMRVTDNPPSEGVTGRDTHPYKNIVTRDDTPLSERSVVVCSRQTPTGVATDDSSPAPNSRGKQVATAVVTEGGDPAKGLPPPLSSPSIKPREGSLEACLMNFTRCEFLGGEDRYACDVCTSLGQQPVDQEEESGVTMDTRPTTKLRDDSTDSDVGTHEQIENGNEECISNGKLDDQKESRKEGGREGVKTVFTDAQKRLLIDSPPQVLTLHLKRFEQKKGRLVKNNRHVRFPPLLDLAPFCTQGCQLLVDHQQQLLYSLYGVVEHHGSMAGGHYVAYVKLRQVKPRSSVGTSGSEVAMDTGTAKNPERTVDGSSFEEMNIHQEGDKDHQPNQVEEKEYMKSGTEATDKVVIVGQSRPETKLPVLPDSNDLHPHPQSDPELKVDDRPKQPCFTSDEVHSPFPATEKIVAPPGATEEIVAHPLIDKHLQPRPLSGDPIELRPSSNGHIESHPLNIDHIELHPLEKDHFKSNLPVHPHTEPHPPTRDYIEPHPPEGDCVEPLPQNSSCTPPNPPADTSKIEPRPHATVQSFITPNTDTSTKLKESSQSLPTQLGRKYFDLSSVEGQWVHVSDSHVSGTTEDKVLNSQAFLLFYEKLPLTDGTS